MLSRTILITCLIFLSIFTLSAGQSLLTKQCDYESIPQVFIEGHSWVNFHKYNDRSFWNAIPVELKQTVLENGKKAASAEPITLTGYDYLLFKQGDSYDIVSQKILAKKSRLEDLMLAEITEGKGNFIQAISNSVWDLCAIGNWTGPESQFLQTGQLGLPSIDKVVVDELTGEIAGALSWAYFFFEDEFNKVDPNINKWVVSSVRSKFLEPNLIKYDFFWMSNPTKNVTYQTPWVCYNWLLSNLLIEKNNDKRQKSIYKALEYLDQFYKNTPIDGECSGGAEIWQYATGKYFQSLELLDMVSVGEIDIYSDDVLKKMGEYICFTHINDSYVFNYSECSPNVILPPSLIYRFGKKVNSKMMMDYGSYLANQTTTHGMLSTGDLFNKISFLIDYNEMKKLNGAEPLLSDAYLPESQMVIARSNAGSTDGYFFGVKGGDNNGFGNQNDAGNFIFYANGKPLFVDAGKTNKTVKSINSERYSIWSNQSAWHNLPTINGYMEESGATYSVVKMVRQLTDNEVIVSMDLGYAYNMNAEITEWTRTFTFNRKNGLIIDDRFNLNQIKGDTYVSFMCYSKPKIEKPGSIVFNIDGEEYEFEYKSSVFSAQVEEINTKNDDSLNDWNSNLYRIVLKPNSAVKSGVWTYSISKV